MPTSKSKRLRAAQSEADILRGSYPIRLAALRGQLSETQQKVGEYFLQKPEAALMAITDVVEDSGYGYGTIMRFCQKIGCRGFQDFKVLLGREIGGHALPNRSDASGDIVKHVQKLQGEIASTADLLDEQTIQHVAKALNKAKQVIVAGIAGSASLAQGFNYRLMRIGMPTQAVCDGYVLALRASLLNKNDVLFAISFSGATKDILAAVAIAKTRGATVIALTNFANAPLAREADLKLASATDRDPLSCEVFSNVAGSFVLDVVFSSLFATRRGAREAVEQTHQAVSDRRL
jgi:DNA-binding MurR/RpiR family transcriptional regulator